MVDVSAKNPSARVAIAVGAIRMSPATLDAISTNSIGKGDVLSVARIAGVMAAKKTSDLIPLCHPIALTDVQVDFTLDESLPGVRVQAIAKTVERTGVEMEALHAASIALLTIYDMAKGIDRGMTITRIALQEKSGGVSGEWKRQD
jgi:cyclic pyranopterin phosphate synthase